MNRKRLPVGKHVGVAVRDRARCPGSVTGAERVAVLRHATQRSVDVGGEDDRSLRAPAAAATGVGVREVLHRPPLGLDLLQLLVGEVGQPAAVGGPEREGRAVGPLELRDVSRREVANRQLERRPGCRR